MLRAFLPAVAAASLLLTTGTLAAAAQWDRCPSAACWDNCPNLGNMPAGPTTLAACEANCSSTPTCTAINFGPQGACSMRACPKGTEPTWDLTGFVGWASYPLKCPPPSPPPPPPPPKMPLFKVAADIVARHGAACLDGSPPYYHYRPATNTSSNRWVLFVNGGAWCFTAVVPPKGGDSCVERARTPGGSSAGASDASDYGGIIGASLERNPDFHGDHHVHIAYCDGTSLSSGRTDPVPVPTNPHFKGPLYFRGRANIDAVVEDLLVNHGMASARDVIFTGGSAGGTAVILQLDHVASLIHAASESTRVVGFPDAGFMLDHENIAGQHEYRTRYWQPADKLWNASSNTNAACWARYGGTEGWKCLLSQYIAPLLTTPVFVMNSLHDLYQLTGGEGILRFPCPMPPSSATCNATNLAAFYQYRTDFISIVKETVLNRAQNGCFLDSCLVHEQNIDACCPQPQPTHLNQTRSGCCTNCAGWSLFSLPDSAPATSTAAFSASGRRTAQQAFGDWFFHRPSASKHQLIDPVAWPNNPSCAYCRH